MLPKSTRGNSVNVQLTLRYGDEQSLANKPGLSSLTAAMLERGTKTRSYQQIRDELDKLKARAYVYGTDQSANVVIETSQENLPAVMKVVGDYLKNPTFPEAEFNKLRDERPGRAGVAEAGARGHCLQRERAAAEPLPQRPPALRNDV